MIPKMWFDDSEEVLWIVFREKWTEEDVPGIFSQMKTHFGDRNDRLIIADLAGAPPQQYSKEMRMLLATMISEFPIHRVGVIGANQALRLMAKFLVSVLRTKIPMEAEFFKTRDEALLWLKRKA